LHLTAKHHQVVCLHVFGHYCTKTIIDMVGWFNPLKKFECKSMILCFLNPHTHTHKSLITMIMTPRKWFESWFIFRSTCGSILLKVVIKVFFIYFSLMWIFKLVCAYFINSTDLKLYLIIVIMTSRKWFESRFIFRSTRRSILL
jgi:hypothetical protein